MARERYRRMLEQRLLESRSWLYFIDKNISYDRVECPFIVGVADHLSVQGWGRRDHYIQSYQNWFLVAAGSDHWSILPGTVKPTRKDEPSNWSTSLRVVRGGDSIHSIRGGWPSAGVLLICISFQIHISQSQHNKTPLSLLLVNSLKVHFLLERFAISLHCFGILNQGIWSTA